MAIDSAYTSIKFQQPEQAPYMSAKDFMQGARDIRNQKRAYAIEAAKRAAFTPDGLDTAKLRQSLTEQGFGEDADAVEREITMARLADLAKTAEIGMQIKAGVDAGIIQRPKAEAAFNTAATAKPIVEPTPDMAWAEGIPQAPTTTESDQAVDGTVRISAPAMTAPKTTDFEYKETKAQAVPSYTADLIDFSSKLNDNAVGEISATGSGISYTLPEGTDRQYILDAAKTLGYTAKTSEELDSQMTARALAMVTKPVLAPKGTDAKSFWEARSEYIKAQSEYPAKVAEAKAKLITELEAGQAARFGQERAKVSEGMAKQAEERAKEAQSYALAGQKDQNIFARKVSPTEAQTVKLQRAVIDDIAMAPHSFEGQYSAALAKARSDGSVSQENIIGNLVAMGAVPSGDALMLKQYITPGGSISSESMTGLKRLISSFGVPKYDKFEDWKKQASKNINQYIIDNGGKPYGTTSAKTSMTSAGVGAKKEQRKSPETSKGTRASKKGR